MAVLAATKLTGKLPVGNLFMQTFSVVVANANAADEWVATGLGSTVAVVGVIKNGTAVSANVPAIVHNARGTGVTAGTNPGDLGLEGDAATYEITVLGRA